jgi:hypothetical protein
LSCFKDPYNGGLLARDNLRPCNLNSLRKMRFPSSGRLGTSLW